MAGDAHELLLRLAEGDEASLQCVLTPPAGLDRRTRELVRLGALLALGASSTSLRWAVELASTNGASDAAVFGALVATAATTGAAQLVSVAPRLGLALGFDFECEPWDEA
jgi:alkylhydroperoxidase/carboxymuconolactone decarboxylase family protein YurZ